MANVVFIAMLVAGILVARTVEAEWLVKALIIGAFAGVGYLIATRFKKR